jgi:hypothetical protein
MISLSLSPSHFQAVGTRLLLKTSESSRSVVVNSDRESSSSPCFWKSTLTSFKEISNDSRGRESKMKQEKKEREIRSSIIK